MSTNSSASPLFSMDSKLSSSMIPRLEIGGKNYLIWSIQMKNLLKAVKVWDVVDPGRTLVLPHDATTEHKLNVSLVYISSALYDHEQRLIMTYEDGRSAWAKLESTIMGKNVASRIQRRVEFLGLQQDPDEDVSSWGSRVSGGAMMCTQVGAKMDDEDLITVFLKGLQPSYASARAAIYTSVELNGNTLEFDAVLSAIKLSDSIESQSATLQASAFLSKPSHNSRQFKRPQNDPLSEEQIRKYEAFKNLTPSERDGLCNHCAGIGHKKEDCRGFKQGLLPAGTARVQAQRAKLAEQLQLKVAEHSFQSQTQSQSPQAYLANVDWGFTHAY